MSVRSDKVGAAIERALQEALARGINDPRIRGLITVTGVEVSPDLRTARVRVSVLPESAQELTLHGLRSAGARLRRDIGDAIRMKRLPELHFELDDSLKRQARVLSAIARAREERPEGAPDDAEEAPDGGGADAGGAGPGEAPR